MASASSHRKGRRPAPRQASADAAEAGSDWRKPTRLQLWAANRLHGTAARGFPGAMSNYQRIFAGAGRYVPGLVWRDGYRALSVSQPRMPFGFVQRGYRYSFAIADLGVAQGHPTLSVLPACIPPHPMTTGIGDYAMSSGQRPTHTLPAGARLRPAPYYGEA